MKNPIELIVEQITSEHHKDKRTKESIQASILRHLATSCNVSGHNEPNVAYEKVVTKKIKSAEFAAALDTIATACLQIFPVVNTRDDDDDEKPGHEDLN